ncbi:MAG: glycosyltransferase [Proteobacteria bacterium]|nr:glycosyltransferase [Pseudomonadota bacterium]
MQVSVILPIFNSESTLEKSLISILNQDFDSFEIIAVNDGSDDKSAEILKSFAQKSSRIKIITNESNRGIVNALNMALHECKGEWIARMDADDIMIPGRLTRQLQFLHDNPDIDLSGSQFQLFSHDDELRSGQINYQNWSNSLITDKEIKREIFIESPISHPTFFAKKQFFLKLGGYLDKEWPEDYDLLLRAWIEGYKMGKVAEILLEKGDIPSRLAYNDSRCSRQSMFFAKAHYLKKSQLFQREANIAVCGTGSTAKKIALALKREKINISFFTDNKTTNHQRYFLDSPVYPLIDQSGKNLLKTEKNHLFILGIGDTQGRIEVESLFKKSGYTNQKDYVRFI